MLLCYIIYLQSTVCTIILQSTNDIGTTYYICKYYNNYHLLFIRSVIFIIPSHLTCFVIKLEESTGISVEINRFFFETPRLKKQ